MRNENGCQRTNRDAIVPCGISLSKHPRAGPALRGLTLAEVQTAAPLRCTTPARIIFASDDWI